jgi:hypothetical protein
MRRTLHGTLLMATGVLHDAVGLVLYRHDLARIARHGVWNTIDDDASPGAAALWFLAFGIVLVILGAFVRHIERTLREGALLPASLGWALGALAVLLVVPMPKTGAWLLFPQAWLLITRKRSA